MIFRIDAAQMPSNKKGFRMIPLYHQPWHLRGGLFHMHTCLTTWQREPGNLMHIVVTVR